MGLWLPMILLAIFMTIQATFAELGVVRYSLLTIVVHTAIVFLFFTDHPLTWILYILTIQMWALFVVTLFRRNKWREGRFI